MRIQQCLFILLYVFFGVHGTKIALHQSLVCQSDCDGSKIVGQTADIFQDPPVVFAAFAEEGIGMAQVALRELASIALATKRALLEPHIARVNNEVRIAYSCNSIPFSEIFDLAAIEKSLGVQIVRFSGEATRSLPCRGADEDKHQFGLRTTHFIRQKMRTFPLKLFAIDYRHVPWSRVNCTALKRNELAAPNGTFDFSCIPFDQKTGRDTVPDFLNVLDELPLQSISSHLAFLRWTCCRFKWSRSTVANEGPIIFLPSARTSVLLKSFLAPRGMCSDKKECKYDALHFRAHKIFTSDLSLIPKCARITTEIVKHRRQVLHPTSDVFEPLYVSHNLNLPNLQLSQLPFVYTTVDLVKFAQQNSVPSVFVDFLDLFIMKNARFFFSVRRPETATCESFHGGVNDSVYCSKCFSEEFGAGAKSAFANLVVGLRRNARSHFVIFS